MRTLKRDEPGRTVEVWWQDEARFGLKGTLSTTWARRGTRPVVPRQQQYDWTYAFTAVNPATGESVSMIAPRVDTGMMNLHLSWISEHVRSTPAGDLVTVVLILDGAGWHKARGLEVPGNIRLLRLPPYSPELNPVERVWLALRTRHLSNRTYRDIDDLESATSHALKGLTHDDIRSIARVPWMQGT